MERFQITPYTYVGLNCAKHIFWKETGFQETQQQTYIYIFSLKEKTTTTASVY